MPKRPNFRQMAREITSLIAPHLANPEETVSGIYDYCRRYQLNDSVFSQLKTISQKFNAIILSKVVGFIVTGWIDGGIRSIEGSCAALLYFADKINQGKENLLYQTAQFINSNRLWGDEFGIIFYGIENRGEKELQQGIALAPEEVLKNSKRSVIKMRFAIATAFLGIEKLRQLLRYFEDNGFDRDQAGHLIWKILPIRGIVGCSLGEKFVVDVVEMIKAAGLKPIVYTDYVLIVLEGKHATRQEVEEVLNLIGQHNPELVVGDHYQLQTMISLVRQPSHREKLIQNIKDNRSGGLDYAYSFSHFVSVLMIDATTGDCPVKLFNRGEQAKEACLRVHELMMNKYAELGIFGAEKQLVEALAQNPLITRDILRGNTVPINSLRHARMLAERSNGIDSVKALFRLSDDNMEAEFTLSLMKVGADQLFELLNNIVPVYHLSIIRAINWYGYYPTMKALDIIALSSLDPEFILPMAKELAKKKNPYYWWDIPIIRTPEIALATAEQERDLEMFLGWPEELRKKMGTAAEIFDRLFEQIYLRITTGFVVRDLTYHSY